jgi:hypothetical protein
MRRSGGFESGRSGVITMTGDFQERARRLRNAVEPVAAGVYFAPEAHEAYAALGFAGSPVAQDGVARPELKSYFTSRGACMGQVPGEVVAAAFGCFNPQVVVPAVAAGWQTTSRDELLEHLDAWSEAIIAAGSYPKRISGVYNVGGGPHFGSGLTVATAAELYAKNA